MPRTPGRLSDGSPRSAAKSRYWSGRTPSSSSSRSAVINGDASTPPLMIRSTRVVSSMRANASRSEVTIDGRARPAAGRQAAVEASTSSASRPAGTTTARPEFAHHLDGAARAARRACRACRRGAPCTRPAVAAHRACRGRRSRRPRRSGGCGRRRRRAASAGRGPPSRPAVVGVQAGAGLGVEAAVDQRVAVDREDHGPVAGCHGSTLARPADAGAPQPRAPEQTGRTWRKLRSEAEATCRSGRR